MVFLLQMEKKLDFSIFKDNLFVDNQKWILPNSLLTLNFKADIFSFSWNIFGLWRSQPDNLVSLCKFQIIVIVHFRSLEIVLELFEQSVNSKYIFS